MLYAQDKELDEVTEITQVYRQYKDVYEKSGLINDKAYSPELIFESGLLYFDDTTGEVKPFSKALSEHKTIKPENITLVPSHILLSGDSPILPAPELTEEQVLRLEQAVRAEDLTSRIARIMTDFKMDTYRGIAAGQSYEGSMKSATVKLMEAIQELASEYSPLHGVLTSPDPNVRVWGARKAMEILEQAAVLYEKETLKRIERLDPNLLRKKQQLEESWHREITGLSKNMYRTMASPDQMLGMLCIAAAAGPGAVAIMALPLVVGILEAMRAERKHKRLREQAEKTSHVIAREKANAMAIRIMGNMTLPEIIIPLAAGESPTSVLAHITSISDKHMELTNRLEEGLYKTLFQYETQKKVSHNIEVNDPQVMSLIHQLKGVTKEVFQYAYNPHLVYMSRQLKESAKADAYIGNNCFELDSLNRLEAALDKEGLPTVMSFFNTIGKKSNVWSSSKQFTVKFQEPQQDQLSVLAADKYARYKKVLQKYQNTINQIAQAILKQEQARPHQQDNPLAEAFRIIMDNKKLYSSYMLEQTHAGLKKRPNADTIPALSVASFNMLGQAFEQHAQSIASVIAQSISGIDVQQKQTDIKTLVKETLSQNFAQLSNSKKLTKSIAVTVEKCLKQGEKEKLTDELKDLFLRTDDDKYLGMVKHAVAPIFMDVMMRIMPPEVWSSVSKLELLENSLPHQDIEIAKTVMIASVADQIKKEFADRNGEKSLSAAMYELMEGFGLQALSQHSPEKIQEALQRVATGLGPEGKELLNMYESVQEGVKEAKANPEFLKGREEFTICLLRDYCLNRQGPVDIRLSDEEKARLLQQAKQDGIKIISKDVQEKDRPPEGIIQLVEQLSGAFNMTATSPLLQKLVQMHSVGTAINKPLRLNLEATDSEKEKKEEEALFIER